MKKYQNKKEMMNDTSKNLQKSKDQKQNVSKITSKNREKSKSKITK